MMEEIKKKLINKHSLLFGNDPLLIRSPGRVNIIGEHTDYNNGFVLPGAVDRYVYVGVSLRKDKLINLYSLDFDEYVFSSIDELKKVQQQWANYVIGVAYEIREKLSSGFDISIYGDVPMGAGMSSSAALESATGYALSRVFDLEISRLDLAKMGQRCEHNYIGVKCGIMDQFSSLFGKPDQVIKLDCRSLQYEYLPFDLGSYILLLLNTKVNHSLASSAYNDRRASCEEAVQRIQVFHPQVESLRDATIDMLDQAIESKKEECYIKARFVIEEIQRVEDVCQYLKIGDIEKVGEKMFETHRGLSESYDVSCKELNFLVDYVSSFPEVLGARMMGGGFGGCTINIVEKSLVEELIIKVGNAYRDQFGIDLDSYKVILGLGTQIIG